MVYCKQNDIENLVRQNLHKVNIGDIFKSKRALFEALSIEVNNNNNKVVEKVVCSFISLNKLSGRSIQISNIDYFAKVTDGRANNKGGNNKKYQDIVFSAILNYDYNRINNGNYITNNQLYTNVLQFPEYSIIDNCEYSDNTSYYKNYLKEYLYEIIDNELKALTKKGIINYSKIQITDLLPKHEFALHSFTALTPFCDVIGYSYLCEVNQLLSRNNYKISNDDTIISLFNACSIDHQFSMCLHDTMKKVFEFEATNSCSPDYISICSSLSSFFESVQTAEKMITSNKKKYPIYNSRNYTIQNQVLSLFGFENVYIGNHIEIVSADKIAPLPDYNINEFLEKIEDKFLEKVDSRFYKRKYDVSIPQLQNLCYYYEADDLVELHTKLFNTKEIKIVHNLKET